MKTLEDRNDIELLVNDFYNKAIADPLLADFFTKGMQTSLEEHLPVIYNFWDSVLFNAKNYHGNVMHKHIDLNKKLTMKDKHFERWQFLFFESLDQHFHGDKADEVKKRVGLMANLMKFKVRNASF